ncbi:MAG: putative zinc-binding metallopeptidase [Bdellovibrionales bacterium]|nr:putative zinc-binding metallopeptidase [Bdellovibrionales bacterium]
MASDWTHLKDEELLKLRICDIPLDLEKSELSDRVIQLYDELDAKKLVFRPQIYLGDEWFSPEGMLAISIPFYLAHPRLKELEQRMMFEVEGGTPVWCQRLLRHEAGHCFDHAYRFSKRRKWREVFGSPDQEYAPETYHPKPYSKSYVSHLDNWYAQAHPDEDFAETFAEWLAPERDWKKRYKGWAGALKKLSYVEELATEVHEKEPIREKGTLPFQASRMKTTLAKYYAKRKKEHETDYPDFYDGDLKRIFNGDPSLSKRDYSAAAFMAKKRKELIDSVAYWTGERKFPIEGLVHKLEKRAENLELRVGRTHADTHLQLSAYLATLVTHYLFTGKFKRRV